MSDNPQDLKNEAKQAFGAKVSDESIPVVVDTQLPGEYGGAVAIGRMHKWLVLRLGMYLIFLLVQGFHFSAYVDTKDKHRPFAPMADASSVIEQVDIQPSGNLVFD